MPPSDPARAALVRAAVVRARRSPFYAAHLAGQGDELAALPLTTKAHLRDATPFGMLAVPPHRAWHYHETSGTSGEPISTWCGLAELRAMAAIVQRSVPELAQDTILLNRFPLFAPVSFVFEEALRAANACHIAAGTMSWDVPFDRAVDFIQRLGVTAVASLPLEPVLLHDVAKDRGLDPRQVFRTVRVVFCGGTILPPALRRAIETDWDARRPDGHQPGARGHAAGALRHRRCGAHRSGRLRLRPRRPGGGVYGRAEDAIESGGARTTPYEVLDAAYAAADELGTRIFFALVRRRTLHLLMEVPDPGRHDAELAGRLAAQLGVPVVVEFLAHNEVLDRSALYRGPKIYKPSVLSDWRGEGRKAITIMEALLEWPKYDARTLLHLARRQFRNSRRRARIIKEDR